MGSVITSLGVGSGIDITQLVSDLVASSREPVTDRLDRNEADFQSKISAYGQVKSALSSFRTSLLSVNDISDFRTRSVSSSNEDIVTATAVSTASEGNYDIVVSAQAASHSLATNGTFSSVTDTVGTGKLTFKFGTTVYDSGTDAYTSFTQNADSSTAEINITSSNNTLEGIRDTVNEADIGVSASIIYDGSKYRLVFASKESGADNSMEIRVDDDDTDDTNTSGLSQLAFNIDATNTQQTQAAADAAFTVNGVAVTSASNTVVGSIPGVTLNINSVDATKTIKVAISNNNSNAQAKVSGFVDSYNNLMNTLNALTDYDEEAEEGGILTGDSLLRDIGFGVRRIITGVVDGLQDQRYDSLANLGVTTQADGTLFLDTSKLSAALTADFDAVGSVFARHGDATDQNVSFVSGSNSVRPGRYLITVNSLATQGYFNGAGNLPADFGATPLVIGAANDNFQIKIDGTSSSTIALTQASYNSGTALAAEIQTRINGDANLTAAGKRVAVDYDSSNNRFVISSAAYGSTSKVEFVSVDTDSEADLGFTVSSGTDGTDISGNIGPSSAVGAGQELTGISGGAAGLVVSVAGATTGARGSLIYSSGIGDELIDLLDGYLGTNGVIQSKIGGLESSIETINDQRAKLDLRMESLELRLLEQFNNMDQIVGNFTNIGSFLTQQLDLLPGANIGNNK